MPSTQYVLYKLSDCHYLGLNALHWAYHYVQREILETYHNYLEFYNMLWLRGNCITHNMEINYSTSKCLHFIHIFRNTLNKVKEAQYLDNFLNIIG